MEFDFLIIGAGAAGCVLANRLSGLPNAPSVCVIERGPSHTDSRWSLAMPAGYTYSYMDILVLKKVPNQYLRYHTEPEKELNGRRIECPRGTGWGGSSVVNSVMFVRGKSAAFDRWTKKDFWSELWSYQQCLPYFKKLENYTPGFEQSDAIDETAGAEYFKCLADYRGSDGPWKQQAATQQSFLFKVLIQPRVHQGSNAGGLQIQYNPYINGATQEGVGWMDSNASNGIRKTASRCYLLPALLRTNLSVVSDASLSNYSKGEMSNRRRGEWPTAHNESWRNAALCWCLQ